MTDKDETVRVGLAFRTTLTLTYTYLAVVQAFTSDLASTIALLKTDAAGLVLGITVGNECAKADL